MSREERDAIRFAIDAAVRARSLPAPDESCMGCGMPYEDWTPGCNHCGDRHRGRKEINVALYRRVRSFMDALAIERSRNHCELGIAAQGGRTNAYV